MAPSLSLAVALDVGRQTFAVMNKVEWLLVAVLLALILTGSRSWSGAIAAGVVALLVLAETFWLLPQLDRRVALVMEGQQLPASGMHSLYVLFELTKLVALAVLAAGMARRLRIYDERKRLRCELKHWRSTIITKIRANDCSGGAGGHTSSRRWVASRLASSWRWL